LCRGSAMGAPLPLCANGEAQAPFAIHTELARAVTPPFNEARTGGPAQGDMMWSIKVISPCAHTISRLERATSLPAESQLYSDCVIVPSQASFPARFMQARRATNRSGTKCRVRVCLRCACDRNFPLLLRSSFPPPRRYRKLRRHVDRALLKFPHLTNAGCRAVRCATGTRTDDSR